MFIYTVNADFNLKQIWSTGASRPGHFQQQSLRLCAEARSLSRYLICATNLVERVGFSPTSPFWYPLIIRMIFGIYAPCSMLLILVPGVGIEPTTNGLSSRYSTAELHGLRKYWSGIAWKLLFVNNVLNYLMWYITNTIIRRYTYLGSKTLRAA